MDCSTCLARHRELRFLMELYIYLRSGCRDADSVERLAERVRGADLALWSHQRRQHADMAVPKLMSGADRGDTTPARRISRLLGDLAVLLRSARSESLRLTDDAVLSLLAESLPLVADEVGAAADAARRELMRRSRVA